MSANSTARVLRINVSITDDKGEKKSYSLFPLKTADRPGVLQAWRLTQLVSYQGETLPASMPYQILLWDTGSVTCDCPGHVKHKHCKHADSLVKGGLIQQDLILATQQARLELASLREQLEREQLAARKTHDDAAELMLVVRSAIADAQEEEAAKAAKPARKPRKSRKQLAEAMG